MPQGMNHGDTLGAAADPTPTTFSAPATHPAAAGPDATRALWLGFDAATTAAAGATHAELDRGSTAALHLQLSDRMRAMIASREWAPGARIPSEHELMQEHGLSLGTVRRAIGALVDEGLLVQERGRGTFVSEPGFVHASGERLLSIAASLREQGKGFTTRVLDERVMPAPDDVCDQMRLAPGDDALFLRRVRVVGSEPVVCQEGWLNMVACPGIEDADFSAESAFDAVERCSKGRISSSRMRYTARRAGRDHGAYLGISADDPVLVLEQLISLDDGTPIEWSLTWLRAGQYVTGMSTQPGSAADPFAHHVRRAGFAAEKDAPLSCHTRQGGRGRLSRTELELAALEIRRGTMAWAINDPEHPYHLGGSLSCAEILAALYNDVMVTGVDGTPWESRDRLVMSKAHASLALYPALAQAGLLSREDLARGLYGPDAVVFKHPRRDVARGLETSGGSLGMGPAHACGIVLSNRRLGHGGRIFCILGDGECNEGSVWEAVELAGHLAMGELTFVVDVNKLQLDGPTADVLDAGTLSQKFVAFGCEVEEVDGHDVIAVRDALLRRSDRPRAVLCDTVKGRGISFIEGRVEWHDKAMTDEERAIATRELDEAEEAIRRG